jgi:IS5 family transposase
MRRAYHDQLPLNASGANHPRAAELLKMGRLLDAMPGELALVCQDLVGSGRKTDSNRGREGMTAEQVLRAALVKQMFDVSYEELAFHMEDSAQIRSFCRISASGLTPKKSALHSNIGAIRAETWEAVNRAILSHARTQKIEAGAWMRTDATVVKSNIHHPLDSALLWDCVRVLTRTMRKSNAKFGTSTCNYSRRAKRRSVGILNAGTMDRRLPLYKDLLKVTRKTVTSAEAALRELREIGDVAALRYAMTLEHYLPLVFRVIDQTERRVLAGEQVPAAEKIVSIFEPHTDIIRKDRRDTYYGHKVTLSTGRSGLVLDTVVEAGNPADATLAVRSVKRHAAVFGAAPERAVFDGGFASKKNLEEIKGEGTSQVCFSKPCGIPLEEMTTTPLIRRTLKRFRAGIEAGISFLKRSFGWTRVTWSGLPHFRAYVWCSTVAHNLLVLARALIRRSKPALPRHSARRSPPGEVPRRTCARDAPKSTIAWLPRRTASMIAGRAPRPHSQIWLRSAFYGRDLAS